MKQLLKPIFTVACFTIMASLPVSADDQNEMIIALKTSDIELVETDISELAVGEARTIQTESGKVIDVLRTADGAEVYIDGELLEMDTAHEGLHGAHQVKKHVEIVCDDDENCEKEIFVVTVDDIKDLNWASAEGDKVIFHKEIELSCTDEEEGTSCDQAVWITEDGDIDLQELHHVQDGEKTHKVIVIRKEILTED